VESVKDKECEDVDKIPMVRNNPMAVSYEDGNEYFGSIKDSKCLN
jgi:hypothetical protein